MEKLYAVVRVRGNIKLHPDIKRTLSLLRLTRVNHCVLIPDTKPYLGMLRKVKDYVTWGEVQLDVLKKLLTKVQLEGGQPLTNAFLKDNCQIESIEALANAIFKNEIQLARLKDVKPVIRLPPPKKGYEGIKRHFTVGGALGYRGDAINDLLMRMLWDLKKQ